MSTPPYIDLAGGLESRLNSRRRALALPAGVWHEISHLWETGFTLRPRLQKDLLLFRALAGSPDGNAVCYNPRGTLVQQRQEPKPKRATINSGMFAEQSKLVPLSLSTISL